MKKKKINYLAYIPVVTLGIGMLVGGIKFQLQAENTKDKTEKLSKEVEDLKDDNKEIEKKVEVNKNQQDNIEEEVKQISSKTDKIYELLMRKEK